MSEQFRRKQPAAEPLCSSACVAACVWHAVESGILPGGTSLRIRQIVRLFAVRRKSGLFCLPADAKLGDGHGFSTSIPLTEAVQYTLDFGTRSIVINPSAPGVTLRVGAVALYLVPYVTPKMSKFG